MKIHRPALYFTCCFLLIVLIGTSGCMTTAGKNYFQLSIPPEIIKPVSTAASVTPVKIEKILMVQPVKADEVYNDYRIVYRNSPYQVNFYPYDFWIKRPDVMIKDTILDFLRKREVFNAVLSDFTEQQPDWILQSTVYIMEEYDSQDSWFAHLKMEFLVKNIKTNERIAFHSFDRMKQLVEKKVLQLPVGISQILREELNILIIKLNDYMNANIPKS